ncbi:MAG: hypothetical protein WCI71_11230 [Bacteroidota bacterium]
MYRKLNIDEYTRQEIEQHFQEATKILDALNVTEKLKEELRGLALGMVGRNK